MIMQVPETIDRNIAPLLIEALRLGRSVRFRAEGRSMEPFLYAGDTVVVDPIKNAPCPPALRPGTVLLYEPKPGILRLHRLSRIQKLADGTYRYRVRGDAPRQPPEEIARPSPLRYARSPQKASTQPLSKARHSAPSSTMRHRSDSTTTLTFCSAIKNADALQRASSSLAGKTAETARR